MTPANPENYQQPSTSTSGDLFTKNATNEGDSDEGEMSLEYAQKVCMVKPLVVRTPRMLPAPERKIILKAADSTQVNDSDICTTVWWKLSETDSLPSIPNQDNAIIISDDSDLEAKMHSFNTEDKQWNTCIFDIILVEY